MERIGLKGRKQLNYSSLSGVLQLGRWCFGFFIIVNIFRHLPDLHDVVLRNGANDPRFVRVPREIRNLCRVATVDELELVNIRNENV